MYWAKLKLKRNKSENPSIYCRSILLISKTQERRTLCDTICVDLQLFTYVNRSCMHVRSSPLTRFRVN